MRVRLLVDLSGTRDGGPWPKRGEVVDLPDAEAAHMLNARLAEAVPDVPNLETAVVKAPARKRAAKALQHLDQSPGQRSALLRCTDSRVHRYPIRATGA